MKNRTAFTLVETLLATGLGLMVLVLLWTVLSTVGRTEERVTGKITAVANAQLALEEIVADLQSMTPPNPYQPETSIRVREDGRAIAFFRTQIEGKRMVARPVSFEARPTKKGHGNLGLYRDGKLVAGLVLRDLRMELVANPSGNPILHVAAVGIGDDLPGSKVRPGDLHTLELDTPLPSVSPAAIIGLPPAALAACRQAVVLKGELPVL